MISSIINTKAGSKHRFEMFATCFYKIEDNNVSC